MRNNLARLALPVCCLAAWLPLSLMAQAPGASQPAKAPRTAQPSSAQTNVTKSRGLVDSSPPTAATLQPGPYYAVVIGNNNYQYLKKLETAVNDAQAMSTLLHDNYGFSVKQLVNATRDDILTALNDSRRNLPASSNLLIYYAGHGYNDRDADEAYWMPVDAQKDNNENWISADDITRAVRTIPSQHVLIISDSCYSGVLTRDADVAINPQERGAFLAKMWSSKSRTLMASGGDEPVADGGGGGHSVFANAILQNLQAMADSEFTAAALFQRVQPTVAGRSEQVPQYSLIRNSGHDYGDFIFSRGGHAFSTPIDPDQNRGGGDTDLGNLTVQGILNGGGDRVPAQPAVSDVDAINKLLDTYQQAYNFRDASLLWKIWPSASSKLKLAIQNSFKDAASIKMDLHVSAPDFAADRQSASVRGQFSEVYVPRNGSAQPMRSDDIVLSFKRVGNIWVVADMK